MNEFVKNDKQKKNDDIELSKREIDVLIAIAKGLMNKEITDHNICHATLEPETKDHQCPNREC